MKGLILAGGRGRRLDELSANRNKCMIEIGGIPVIQHNLDNITGAGVEDIVIVVGYRAEEIINRYGTEYAGARLQYVIQWEQKGLVHAMESAKDAIAGDDFFLLLGDEVLIEPKLREMVDEYSKIECFAMCGVLHVDDRDVIKRTYSILQDDSGRILRLVEKPRNPMNSTMGTGHCVFRNEMLDYIDMTPIHHERGEKELPDLIQCAIDDGRAVQSFTVCGYYANINSRDDISRAEEYVEK